MFASSRVCLMPRSTRDRPAKTPLSRDAVIDAGMRVLRESGLGAVTMRKVAAELDTGAASLYVYVANADELRMAMFDRTAREIPTHPIEPERWREQFTQLAHDVVAALDAYPGIAQVALGNVPL